MESLYKYLQPTYVSKFQCDGKKCPANCCCRDWKIIVDDKTYKKYSEIETDAHEITKNLLPNEESEGFIINQVDGKCPMMTDEGLCKIQLEHGEEYLSQTCLSYPRQLVNFGEIIERTLTPTCPLAAELILNSAQIKFEFQPVELPKWAKGKLTVGETKVPQEFFPHILEIQITSVSILQERRLTIDQRLAVLGFYLFQIEDMQKRGELNLISTLNKIYTSEEFFSEQIPVLIQSINFQILEFAESFFGLLKNIYGDEKILKTAGNQKYIDILNRVMSFNSAEELNTQELAENYFDLGGIRKIFLKNYETFFENYLVNDFFGGVYPFKVDGTIQNNFSVFVATFKILENIALAMTAESQADEKNLRAEILEMLENISMDLNHNENYISAVTKFLKEKSDIRFFMRSFLQTK
ncbi:MAG: flagellin lysine-N-methylase [Selenomonadaceae bacterium]|nr:flagellin lysine-N-methylase [Selenomonadaceae bacterium]